jgi:hypothetical protein
MASNERQNEYNHIVEVLLDASAEDHPINIVLRANRASNLRHLNRFLSRNTAETISTIRWTDPADGEEKELPEDHQEELLAIVSYRNFLQNDYGTINSPFDITTKDRDDFLNFIDYVFLPQGPVAYDGDRALAAEARRNQGSSAPPVPPPPSPRSNGDDPIDGDTERIPREIRDFDKGVKRDPSVYPKFEKNYEFTQWYRQFSATARSQGLKNILNPDYCPKTPTEITLFARQQEFMYNVLANTCTKVGKADEYVQTYEATNDAQKIIEMICKHFQQSSIADARSDELFVKITTTTIPDPRRKPIVDYIADWNRWVLEYNQLVPNKMSDLQKLTHLKNYTSSIEGLKSIATLAKTVQMCTSIPMSPENTMILIGEQSAQIDADERKLKLAALRRVNFHISDLDYDDDDHKLYDDYHRLVFAASTITLGEGSGQGHGERITNMHLTQDYVGEAFQSERRGIIKLSDEAWNALSPNGKKLWRNLNHDDRLQILEFGKPPDTNTNAGSPTPPTSPTAGSKTPPPTRKITFAESIGDPRLANSATHQSPATANVPDETTSGDSKLTQIDQGILDELKAGPPADTTPSVLDPRANDDSKELIKATQTPLVSKKEAENLSAIDVIRYTNQSNDHTAHKKQRYHDWKKEQTPKSSKENATDSTTSPSKKGLAKLCQAVKNSIGDTINTQSRKVHATSWTSAPYTAVAPTPIPSSVVDRGANNGIAGHDLRAIHYDYPPRTSEVSTINERSIGTLPIGTFGGTCNTTSGQAILIFHQYAHDPTGTWFPLPSNSRTTTSS